MSETYAIHTVRRSGSHVMAQWIGAMLPEGAFYANENSASANGYISPEGVFTHSRDAPDHIEAPLIYGRQDIPAHESRHKCPNPAAKHILLLRDPINLFASKASMTKDQRPKLQRDRTAFQLCWISHAMEYLDLTSFLPRKICVDYNSWCASEEYRRAIAEKLGLEYSKDGLEGVPRDGGGSTWDGLDKPGKDLRAVAHERFHRCLEDDFYRSLINEHPIMWELCERIWPEVAQAATQAGLRD